LSSVPSVSVRRVSLPVASSDTSVRKSMPTTSRVSRVLSEGVNGMVARTTDCTVSGSSQDVAAVLSVPFATDHPLPPDDGRPLPADFAPTALSSRRADILPAYARMTAPPQYGSPEAMRALIRGDVEIAFVVEPDGHVGATRITQSLDARFGLDALSLSSLKAWVFEPALLAGRPVATRNGAVMNFNLK